MIQCCVHVKERITTCPIYDRVFASCLLSRSLYCKTTQCRHVVCIRLLFAPRNSGGAALRQLFGFGQHRRFVASRRICVTDFVVFGLLMAVVTVAFFLLPQGDSMPSDTPTRNAFVSLRHLAADHSPSAESSTLRLTPAPTEFGSVSSQRSQQPSQQRLTYVCGRYGRFLQT
jgi:hypothetical protein